MATSSVTSKSLMNFIQQNHDEYGIRIHENLAHHNHTPHLLGSAFLLGANKVQLEELFKDSSSQTDRWTTPPAAITEKNFIDHLGKAEYQKAYVDFFSTYSGDWKDMASEYLFRGPFPLFTSLMSGLTHPMIHLAYAIELQSRALTIEALGLAATCHDFMHEYLEQEKHTRPTPSEQNSSQHQILNNIYNDPRFNNAHVDTIQDTQLLFQAAPNAFLDHWKAWTPDPAHQPLTQKLAVTLLAAPDANDFVFCHALTSYHAIQVIAQEFHDETIHANLCKQWWLWVVMAYVMQGRPAISFESIEEYKVESRDWTWVRDQVLTGKWRKEHHIVKATRAIMNAAEKVEEGEKIFYLKAAVKFLDKFDGWTGFGKDSPSFERHVVDPAM